MLQNKKANTTTKRKINEHLKLFCGEQFVTLETYTYLVRRCQLKLGKSELERVNIKFKIIA